MSTEPEPAFGTGLDQAPPAGDVLSYEQAAGRVEEIIRRLDSGEASLQETLSLVGEGKLVLPVQQTFLLEQVVEAERLSQAGHLRGKLVLLVD